MTTTNLAGSFLNADRMKQISDMFSPFMKREEDQWLIPMLAWQEAKQAEAENPQRLKEKLDVLGPWYENIANKSQQLGLQSNLLGAGINAIQQIPNTMLAMRAIPLAGMSEQTQNLSNMFTTYGGARPGFSGVLSRLGGR
jgi:hypothetical protein